jgi:hypothetical protein
MGWGPLLRDKLRHFPMKIRVMYSEVRHRSATLLWIVGAAGRTYFRLLVIAFVIGKGIGIFNSSIQSVRPKLEDDVFADSSWQIRIRKCR